MSSVKPILPILSIFMVPARYHKNAKYREDRFDTTVHMHIQIRLLLKEHIFPSENPKHLWSLKFYFVGLNTTILTGKTQVKKHI